jgi:hypothetical protein
MTGQLLSRSRALSFCVCSAVIGISSAWLGNCPPAIRKQSSPFAKIGGHNSRLTVLTASAKENEFDRMTSTSSRRQWFSQIGSAGVAAIVSTQTPSTAHAAGTTKPLVAKPTPALCDPSVSVWTKSGRTVYLVGTAHISAQSAMLAGDVIKDTKPEAVFVELDAKRIGAAGARGIVRVKPIAAGEIPATAALSGNIIVDDGSATSDLVMATMDPTTVAGGSEVLPSPLPRPANPFDLRERAMQAASQAVGNAIKGMYKRLDTTGFKPGEEFVVAVQEGDKVGATIILGDRDVEVTLQRLTKALAETDLQQLMSPDSELERSMQELLPSGSPDSLMSDAQFKDEMTRYVEVMKAKENVQKIMGQLKQAAPKLYEALVAERDVYMASGLDQLNQFPSMVAVMGVAHVEGVEAYLQAHGWKPVKLRCPRA